MRLIFLLKKRELVKIYIQAHKCLNKDLQRGFVSDDTIKEAQSKRDKILYIENIKKYYLDPYWDIHNEVNELVNIVADLNGSTPN